MTKSKDNLHETMADAIAEDSEISAPPTAKQQPTRAGLYRKMAVVMSKLKRLPKAGWNIFHKYHYVTDADVMEALRVNLAEAGLAFLPNIINVVRDNNRVTVEIALTLADTNTGETIAATWFGEANDKKGTDDKAIQKAVTAAVKYFLLKTFLISTGDEAQDTDSGISDKKQANPPSPPKPRKETKASASPSSKLPSPTRAKLEKRWDDLWHQAIALGLNPDDLPATGPDDTNAELTAAGKKLAVIVKAAKPKPTWDAETVTAVLQAELSENNYSVINTLKKSNLTPSTPTDVVVMWFRQYRASRDAGGDSDEAAIAANA